jgi:hypothetical protein
MKIYRKTVKIEKKRQDEAMVRAINIIVKNSGIKLLDHSRSKGKLTIYYTLTK